ncbi:MAG: DUF255 domain-containing protein [Thermoanaerobaculia bacterium]
MTDSRRTPGAAATPNRLAGESSPYLLLHAENPVDWYPWGDEALARAREEDRPLFLSVGYSTCYWCHVMERESFSDPEVARLMNERFVNVKVDREERPDIDEVYMIATQILAGQGGWPNSVFLTPELKPFYAGTYFPPDDRYGRPGFPAVLRGLADAWEDRRDDVQLQADEVAQAMGRVLEERFAPGDEPAPAGAALGAYRSLERSYDPVQGGFGSAPKFPTPSNLFLLRELVGHEEAPEAADMLSGTLDAMARGGIYDQLGGGFHRYATDGRWLVPHFEKMLYDNGFLLELYALEHERTGSPEAARIARETAELLVREMSAPDGVFWSAIDAETGGREGAFYVWSGEELREVLGDEDFAFLAPIYGFDREPTFEGSDFVLHLPDPLEEQAARRRRTREDLLEEIEPLRRRLFEARARRERPATDDKVLADWNGMAIRGMALAGRALEDRELVGRAARAAEGVLGTMRPGGGPLLHAIREGEGRVAAFLSDYAFLVRGLLALHEVAGEGRWLEAAAEIAGEQDERLAHPDGGWYNAAESPDLLFRSQEIFDGATPAANGIAVLNLLDLAERTGEGRFRETARRALAAFSPAVGRAPDACRTLALANLRFHGGVLDEDAGRSGPDAAAPGAGPGEEAEAAVHHRLAVGEPGPDGAVDFRLRLEVAPGWHVYAADAPADRTKPLRVEARGGELLDVVWPPGDPLAGAPDGEDPVPVHTGAVEITGRLRPEGDDAGLVLSFQACDDRRCLPPAERVVPVRS